MAEAEIRVNSEGSDEESIVLKATASEALQMETNSSLVPSVGIDSDTGPSATGLVKVVEQSSSVTTEERVGDEVVAVDEQKKGSILDKEGTIESEKGSTPGTSARRRPERKKKVSGNDNIAEPSSTVLGNVEGQAPAIMTTNNEDKAGEGGNKEHAVKGETVDEGKKDGALNNPASRIQKRKKVAVAVAKASTAGITEATKDDEEKTVVTDEVEDAQSKEEVDKEEVPDERKKASALTKRARRLQKVKTAASAVTQTAKDKKDEKTDVEDNVEGDQEVVLDDGEKASTANKKAKSSQEMEMTDLTLATTSAAITAETANDNGEKVGVEKKDEVGKSPNKKNKKKRKRNKARVAAAEASGAAEVGGVKKLPVAKELAGMIFMCNTETKRDCYKYKIFGMPAGKKETVANVHKGMKLFLYDIDLKLLYGIYVASSKGGYNIQPKAFKSAFPSQVRFKVLKDYLPLPEEKFKSAIKTNYYGKKKFNLELSAEQVKNLSKLFAEASKASKRTNGRATRERVTQDFAFRDTKRKRFQGTVMMDEDDRMFPRRSDIYEREAYASQVPLQVPYPPPGSVVQRQVQPPLYSPPPQHAPLPPPVYVYERPREFEYYRGELPMEARAYRLIDPDIRLPIDHVGRNDPYGLHGEPPPYHEIRYPTLPSSYSVPAPPAYHPRY